MFVGLVAVCCYETGCLYVCRTGCRVAMKQDVCMFVGLAAMCCYETGCLYVCRTGCHVLL